MQFKPCFWTSSPLKKSKIWPLLTPSGFFYHAHVWSMYCTELGAKQDSLKSGGRSSEASTRSRVLFKANVMPNVRKWQDRKGYFDYPNVKKRSLLFGLRNIRSSSALPRHHWHKFFTSKSCDKFNEEKILVNHVKWQLRTALIDSV